MLAAADPAATMLHCAQIDELVNAGKRVEAARMGSLLVETQLHEVRGGGGGGVGGAGIAPKNRYLRRRQKSYRYHP